MAAISLNSWMKGKKWVEDMPSNVQNISKLCLPDGKIYLSGRVRNSRGGWQTATATVSADWKIVHQYDGGTVLEDGMHETATYHVAALIYAAKREIGR